jgi:SAM-dependent methyltransferase
VNGLELFLLGRRLMKIGEDALPRTGLDEFPTSVRSIMLDVFEHPNSSVGEITARTGFPQSHVSASVARLQEAGVLVTSVDAEDRRRTLVRAAPDIPLAEGGGMPEPVDRALAAALGTGGAEAVPEVLSALDVLRKHLAVTGVGGPDSGLPLQPRRPRDFSSAYGPTPPPWDIGRPQPPFVALAEAGELRGRVLDAGCGTGEHALLAAGLGLDAVGVDIVPTAIEAAKGKARERGLTARFEVWDALQLAGLDQQFDTVLDCGLFHILSDEDRVPYVAGLAAVVRPGGRYFMLCFSDRQPGALGPRRVTQDEIRSSFSDGWRVEAIEPATIETLGPAGSVQAWLATLTRL